MRFHKKISVLCKIKYDVVTSRFDLVTIVRVNNPFGTFSTM